MSGLAVLLLAAGASAYGVWASLKSRPPLWSAALSAVLFAAAGVIAILASWISGDGVVLPGLQLSPGLRDYYLTEAEWGLVPSLSRWLVFLGPLGHLILAVVRRDRATVLVPFPATAVFLWLLLATAETPTAVVRARGAEQVAYLTIVPHEDGARLILAAGEPFSSFLRVLHVHETLSAPPQLHLHWTNDGKVLVVRVHDEEFPSFAVDLDGNVTGALPVEAREWTEPGDYVPGDVRQRFSEFRKDVSKLVHEHRGLAPE